MNSYDPKLRYLGSRFLILKFKNQKNYDFIFKKKPCHTLYLFWKNQNSN